MQIFILLYIEAGSYINEEEEGWEFVVLFVIRSFSRSDFLDQCLQVRKTEAKGWTSDVSFCGLFIAVQLLLFPRKSAVAIEVSRYILVSTLSRFDSCMKSQFVILPPYQRRSHGCK